MQTDNLTYSDKELLNHCTILGDEPIMIAMVEAQDNGTRIEGALTKIPMKDIKYLWRHKDGKMYVEIKPEGEKKYHYRVIDFFLVKGSVKEELPELSEEPIDFTGIDFN